jgi:hypothetical protein
MHCFSHGDPALRRALSPRAICQLDRRAGGGIGRQLTAVSRSPQGWRWLSCPVLTRSHGTSLAPIRSPTGAGQVTGPPYRGGGQNLGRHARALLRLAPLRSPRISASHVFLKVAVTAAITPPAVTGQMQGSPHRPPSHFCPFSSSRSLGADPPSLPSALPSHRLPQSPGSQGETKRAP